MITAGEAFEIYKKKNADKIEKQKKEEEEEYKKSIEYLNSKIEEGKDYTELIFKSYYVRDRMADELNKLGYYTLDAVGQPIALYVHWDMDFLNRMEKLRSKKL